MNTDQFWQLIDGVHAGSHGGMREKCDLLRGRLATLSSEEILAFMDHFGDRMDRAYSWDLWGAAYVIGGGCGDDMFMDFRSNLISHGRDRYERSLQDPDSLAELSLSRDIFFEGFSYVALKIYRERTGQIPVRKGAHPTEPSGLDWEEDDLPKRFPKLFAKYRWEGVPTP